MPSSQSARSDIDSEISLPSPASSVKSSNSQISSRKGSPSVDSDSNGGKRRRSTRISHQGEINYLPPTEDVNLDKDEPKLILKKRKFETKSSLDSKPLRSKKVITISAKDGKLQFNEPDVEDDTVSVTGLPLNAPPSAKIKKESLWAKRKSTPAKSTPETKASPITKKDTTETQLLKQKNKSQSRIDNLKTKLNEKIQKQSSLRFSKSITPVLKKGSEKYFDNIIIRPIKNTTKAPKGIEKPSTPHKKKPNNDNLVLSPNKEKRKIKNASPKKARANAFGFGVENPIKVAREKKEAEQNDDNKSNDDYCAACGEPGIFLCCETCPRSFHFACCDPPFSDDNLPDDEWYCNECEGKRNPQIPRHSGLFGKLLDHLEYRNPTQFQLPKKIRERFEGVVTGSFGEYESTDYKDYKPAKIHSFQQTDPDLHFDKDGNILYCAKCGTSGISSDKVNGGCDKLIASCEYCPSAWHLDCLDPPLSTIKQLGIKWKCPNHADHFLPYKHRRLKKPNIIDVDQVYGFKNDGNIEVLLDESSEDDYDSDDYHEIERPPFFNNEDTENGISAPLPKSQQKLWNDSFSVYRVPEKGILLDFWSKINFNREQQEQRSLELLELARQNNALLVNLSKNESYDNNERETIQTLVELKDVDFKGLLSLAAKELNASTIVQNTDISRDELDELRHIKKLMKLKGQEKLMEFLKQ